MANKLYTMFLIKTNKKNEKREGKEKGLDVT